MTNTVKLDFEPHATVAARYQAIGDKGDVYNISYGPVTNYTVHVNGHMYRFGIRCMSEAVQYAECIRERRKLG